MIEAGMVASVTIRGAIALASPCATFVRHPETTISKKRTLANG
jgi:hypothetical protein